MSSPSSTVDAFLAALDHPLHGGVERLRATILASDPDLTEVVKWNAPSYRYAGDDRVTFRLAPRGQLQLIFHRGAQVRDAADFRFDDPSGLLTWRARDRAVLDFPDLEAVDARLGTVAELVPRWVRA